MPEPERIYGFRDSYFFLSNFFVERDGKTGEHRFQAAKVAGNPVWHDRIMSAPTPAKAKYHGRSCPLRPDWEQVKDEVMREVVERKFRDPQLRRLLLRTATAELIEANEWGDREWGVDQATGVGKNKLGRILMDVRAGIARDIVGRLRHPLTAEDVADDAAALIAAVFG